MSQINFGANPTNTPGSGQQNYGVIPPSLATNIYSQTPFFLVLYGAETVTGVSRAFYRGWRGWIPEQVKSEATRRFVLPLPERGFGTSTELKATDEEKFLGYPAMFGAIGVARAAYGDNWMNEFMAHGLGGYQFPIDFTALTVYGTKKRTFQFTLDLYALDSEDSNAIAQFCYDMHGNSTVRPRTSLQLWQGTPYVWTFEIWNADMENVTKLWMPSPQACAMLNFYNTSTNYVHTHDGYAPARNIVTMMLTEIEPVAFDPNTQEFRPAWDSMADVADITG